MDTNERARVISRLRLAAARRRFDAVPSSELPALAMAALEAGLETPSVIALAAAAKSSWADCEKHFNQMLEELGLTTILTLQQAGLRVALHQAREILSGTASPYEGTSRLANLALHFDQDDAFWRTLVPFVGLASEWEDHSAGRTDFDESIRAAAESLEIELRST